MAPPAVVYTAHAMVIETIDEKGETVPPAQVALRLAAALQENARNRGKRVGLILSGGNIDFDLFQKWIGTEVTVTAAKQALA